MPVVTLEPVLLEKEAPKKSATGKRDEKPAKAPQGKDKGKAVVHALPQWSLRFYGTVRRATIQN